ncbi:MAG: hypothetical protein FK730_12995 [Asgard group archaeon]|nr:hypothetical protein [Asgard group archaeon]
MVKQTDDLLKLIVLLKKAAKEMIAKGDLTTHTDFDSCEKFGYFLEKIAIQLEKNEEIDANELLTIFLPTGVWDDFYGSNELADKSYFLIKKCFFTSS